MGHYDDVRERREEAEFAARAKREGISVEALVEEDRHEERIRQGRKLYQQRRCEAELIAYYKTYQRDLYQ
tara:strand:+ start:392 stop:601 length:210 start_codon:yes stop_codon:yes gene_type:complete